MPEAILRLDNDLSWSSRWLRAVARRQVEMRDTALHSHAQGQLIGSLDGVLSVRAANGRWVVPRSYAVWLPPLVPHAMRSYGAFAGWSLYMDTAAAASFPSEPRAVRVDPLLRALVDRVSGWGAEPWDAARHRLATVMMDEIAALRTASLDLAEPADARARQVTAGILADLADNRTAADWAHTVGMTSRTLARRFRAETGLGLAEWRQRARALQATEMLAEGRSVTAVALDMGYRTTGAFIDMFKRSTGTTPGRVGRARTVLDARRAREDGN